MPERNQPSLLHVTGGPGSEGEVGWDAPAAGHPQRLLDIWVSERIDDWVDHRAAGGWKDRGIGVYYRVAGVSHDGVHGKRQPARPEGTQDGRQCGDTFGGGDGHELVLHGNLLRVAEGDLADLQVELHHQGKDEQEGDGQRHGVVFGDGPADAARGLVSQTVPPEGGQQAKCEARHPDEDHHHVGEGDCSFSVVGQGVVQRQITVHCDGQNVQDRRREG